MSIDHTKLIPFMMTAFSHSQIKISAKQVVRVLQIGKTVVSSHFKKREAGEKQALNLKLKPAQILS